MSGRRNLQEIKDCKYRWVPLNPNRHMDNPNFQFEVWWKSHVDLSEICLIGRISTWYYFFELSGRHQYQKKIRVCWCPANNSAILPDVLCDQQVPVSSERISDTVGKMFRGTKAWSLSIWVCLYSCNNLIFLHRSTGIHTKVWLSCGPQGRARNCSDPSPPAIFLAEIFITQKGGQPYQLLTMYIFSLFFTREITCSWNVTVPGHLATVFVPSGQLQHSFCIVELAIQVGPVSSEYLGIIIILNQFKLLWKSLADQSDLSCGYLYP